MSQKITVVHRNPDTGRNIGHDLTGIVVGKLTVSHETGERCKNGYKIWRSFCACGKTVDRPSYRYLRGATSGKGPSSCCPKCAPTGRPRKPNNASHLNAIWRKVQKSAMERHLEFDLTVDQVRSITKLDCSYCGAKPLPRVVSRNLAGMYAHNGIDRIDSTIGYVWSNVTPCCGRCNIAKSDMTLMEFKEWAVSLYKHLQGRTLEKKPSTQQELPMLDRNVNWRKPKILMKQHRLAALSAQSSISVEESCVSVES